MVSRMRDQLGLDIDRLWAALDPIEGWFYRDEADVLAELVAQVVTSLSDDARIVEIGSYHGRSTALIASVVDALAPGRRVVAIDPHEGRISESGRPDAYRRPTWDSFRHNLRQMDLLDAVDVRKARAVDVVWTEPVGLLFVDGLHDSGSVRGDFDHFAPWLVVGGIVAFHDYSPNFPGVIGVVDDVLSGAEFVEIARAGDLMAVRRTGSGRSAEQ